MLRCVVVKHALCVNIGFCSWPGGWPIGEESNVKQVLCCATRRCIVLCGVRYANTTVDNIDALYYSTTWREKKQERTKLFDTTEVALGLLKNATLVS